jgi:hypothetical protein
VVITPRDVRILRDLFDSRILTAQQIADIHFHADGTWRANAKPESGGKK